MADDEFNDELISAYLDGELTSEEQALVEQELQRCTAHRRMFDELRVLRQTLQALPVREPQRDLTDAILRRAEREMLTGPAEERRHGTADHEPSTGPAPTPQRWHWSAKRLLSLAAALAACLLLAVLLVLPRVNRVAELAPTTEPMEAASTAPSKVSPVDGLKAELAEDAGVPEGASRELTERADIPLVLKDESHKLARDSVPPAESTAAAPAAPAGEAAPDAAGGALFGLGGGGFGVAADAKAQATVDRWMKQLASEGRLEVHVMLVGQNEPDAAGLQLAQRQQLAAPQNAPAAGRGFDTGVPPAPQMETLTVQGSPDQLRSALVALSQQVTEVQAPSTRAPQNANVFYFRLPTETTTSKLGAARGEAEQIADQVRVQNGVQQKLSDLKTSLAVGGRGSAVRWNAEQTRSSTTPTPQAGAAFRARKASDKDAGQGAPPESRAALEELQGQDARGGAQKRGEVGGESPKRIPLAQSGKAAANEVAGPQAAATESAKAAGAVSGLGNQERFGRVAGQTPEVRILFLLEPQPAVAAPAPSAPPLPGESKAGDAVPDRSK